MVDRFLERLRQGVDHEYSAAIALSLGAVAAVTWSGLWPHSYFTLTTTATASGWAQRLDATSLHQFVIDGLMTIFFYAIGLELRREIQSRDPGHVRRAITPMTGALGGMVATALLSVALGELWHSDALLRGWGVPMATDVAFTLGALALLGRRLPTTLYLFVLTLAIGDDVLSVIVLLFTGATRLAGWWLLGAGVVFVLSWRLGRRARSTIVSVATLVALWFCFSQAHLEPALAGVAAGALVAANTSTHARLERHATRLSSMLALPLFGFVAVGLHWSSLHVSGATGTVMGATILIRLVGKVVGISGGVFLAMRLGFPLPEGVTRSMLVAVATLCAMGLTVPLLFADRLFGAASATYAAFSLGLLLASVLAGLIGFVILRATSR
ncbi:MAG TPA: Na+/H+ antiporter NhaA [Acidimicrobiales bacterium]|nr:Na+/H+ antiporter NhaA [Acidimicrobiales bacterium]